MRALNFTRWASGRDSAAGHGRPVYVIDIDAAMQRVIVGDYDDLLRRDCFLAQTNWGEAGLTGPTEITTKIRYNYPEVAAVVHPPARPRAAPARISGTATLGQSGPGRGLLCGRSRHRRRLDRAVGTGFARRTEESCSGRRRIGEESACDFVSSGILKSATLWGKFLHNGCKSTLSLPPLFSLREIRSPLKAIRRLPFRVTA